MPLRLSPFVVVFLLLAGNLWGAGIFSLTCDGVVMWNKVAFAGLDSGAVACAFGDGSLVSFEAKQTSAGLNRFLDTIHVDWDTRQAPQNAEHTVTFHVFTTPTWTAPPPDLIPTVLGLTGHVHVTDAPSSLSLDLIGWLGGPKSEIKGTLTPANCGECDLNQWVYKGQARDPTADEWLTVKSIGRVTYKTDSPVFAGEIPEPGSLGMALLGAALLLGAAARRR